MGKSNKSTTIDKFAFHYRLKTDIKKNYPMYLLLLPVLAYYLIFCYKPMYGAIIAFKDYSPAIGIWDSPWVGFSQFQKFFEFLHQ